MMELLPVLKKRFQEEITQFAKETPVPYITSIEEYGMEKGLMKGIELCLKIKFGSEGLKLLPEIRQIHEVGTLETILDAIETAATPDDVRKVWAGKAD